MGIYGAQPDQVVSLTQGGSETVRFVSTGPTGQLVGSNRKLGNRHNLDLCLQPGGSECITDIGCATEPLVADAVAMDGGHIFAYSTSRPFGDCVNDDGIDGPPDTIQLGFLGGPGGGFGPLATNIVFPGDAVSYVRLLPHSEGAWLLYQVEGRNAEVQPPVQAMRIDSGGDTLLSSVPVVDDGGRIGAGTLGDRLVVAWADTADPFGGWVRVQIYDDNGTPGATHAAKPVLAGRLFSDVTLLGSPSADEFVVGWAQRSDDEGLGTPYKAFAARFSCVK